MPLQHLPKPKAKNLMLSRPTQLPRNFRTPKFSSISFHVEHRKWSLAHAEDLQAFVHCIHLGNTLTLEGTARILRWRWACKRFVALEGRAKSYQLFHLGILVLPLSFDSFFSTLCYIMPAARAYLQISLGKTRSTPTCMHELMTSHVAVKDHVTPWGVW